MEEFFILKCPVSSSINTKIKNIFINKFLNDGLQLKILDDESEESDDDIYNYTRHVESNFCGLAPLMSPNYVKDSIQEEDTFALMKFLNVDDVHSIITFKVMTDYNKNSKYLYIDAYCVNKIKGYFGAGILLDYLVHVCKNIGINEIKLDALLRDETINFYIKKGFQQISSNSSYAKMLKIINGGYSNKKKNKNKKYKTIKYKTIKYKTIKYKTRKYKTRKYKTKKYKTKKYKTRNIKYKK
jgi:hypothetical protein